MTKSQLPTDLVTFTEEIFNRKFDFLCNGGKQIYWPIYDSLLQKSCSRQQINKAFWVGYNIWVLAETCNYLVKFETCQGIKKENRLSLLLNGEKEKMLFFGCWNAYLQLLVIIYLKIMNNYFTTSRLLTHLGVRNIQAAGMLKKNRLRKCTIIRDKQVQKIELWQFWTSYIKQKKGSANLTVAGYNYNRVASKSSKPKIYLWHLNKIGKTIFKNNNQINSTVTTGHRFSRQNGPECCQVIDWYLNEKMVFVLLAWMFDVIHQNAWVLHHINKDEGD